MTVSIYRSSDPNAPFLSAGPSQLVALLDACLVNGYGSTKATATITSSGVAPSDGDTVTLDGVVYTFKTALTPTAGQVLIGASAAAALTNLAAAMMDYGTRGTNYATGTTVSATTRVKSVSATVIIIEALKGGTSGNSIALAKSAATLTLSGSTLASGAGSDTKAGAGWTIAYTAAGKRSYRMASSVRASSIQYYLDVDDSGPGAGNFKEGRWRGYETMSAVATGTNPFPTVATNPVLRKSSQFSVAESAWIVIADGRTVYVFINTGDGGGTAYWSVHSFGDFYTYGTSDFWNATICARTAENDATLVADSLDLRSVPGTNLTRHNNARIWNGTVVAAASGHTSAWYSTAAVMSGNVTGVNSVDGKLWLAPIYIHDGSQSANIRGQRRGLWHCLLAGSTYQDGDVVTGSGDLAGRTFMLIKATGNVASLAFEISDTWDTNS